MKTATLSVVVCNYNHGHYIEESLQAILDQSLRPLEVIVIDDGSTDDSVQLVEEIARRDPVVRLHRNEQNMGVWFSANRGLKLAGGDYVVFAAADDRVCPGFFEKSMTMLSRYPDAGLCSALLSQIGPDGEDRGWVPSPVISDSPCYLSPREVLATLIRDGFWLTGHTTICRRDVILRETDGFLPELRHYADHLVDMVVALKCGACFIPETLATWRVLDTGYAETHFNDAELSRETFEKITREMRSERYSELFPETFLKVWEERGRYGFEMRQFRRILDTQFAFIDRLKQLSPEPSLLDRAFIAAIRLLTVCTGLLAKAYLWHRRINWNLSWVVRRLRYSSRGRSLNQPAAESPTPAVCPYCHGTGDVLYAASDENRRVSTKRFNYARCKGCNVIFLAGIPQDLARYYQADYYEIPALETLRAVAERDRTKIDTVLNYVCGGRLLEVGPAFGVFAWQAKQAGFTVDVIEMDSRCCEFLRDHVDVNVSQSSSPHSAMESLPPHDVIAIWHVLEHLPQPDAFLRAAAINLADGGVLVVAMPNPDAFQFRLMGRHWPHLDAPRHLALIPAPFLVSKARELGLDLISVTSDDGDARSWNRFGWQRLLMNRFTGKTAQRAMFVLGYLFSIVMRPFERGHLRGSAYTAVFKKTPSP